VSFVIFVVFHCRFFNWTDCRHNIKVQQMSQLSQLNDVQYNTLSTLVGLLQWKLGNWVRLDLWQIFVQHIRLPFLTSSQTDDVGPNPGIRVLREAPFPSIRHDTCDRARVAQYFRMFQIMTGVVKSQVTKTCSLRNDKIFTYTNLKSRFIHSGI